MEAPSCLQHLSGIADGMLAWADDLQESLSAGDRHYRAFVSEVDAYVAQTQGRAALVVQ